MMLGRSYVCCDVCMLMVYDVPLSLLCVVVLCASYIMMLDVCFVMRSAAACHCVPVCLSPLYVVVCL